MKRVCVSIFSVLCVVGVVGARPQDSLLTAATFPKTANDLTFRQRMELLADDYNNFDSLFDADGNCIMGCAYPGLKLADAIAESARATQEVNAILADYYAAQAAQNVRTDKAAQTPDNNAPGTPNQAPQPSQAVQPAAANNNQNPTPAPVTSPDPSDEYKCPTNQYSSHIKRGNQVVDMAPLDGALVVTSDFGPRKFSNGTPVHKGVDLAATDNTPVYLPANGVVDLLAGGPRDAAGYYIRVYHPTEKIYTYYMHLNDRLVKKGDKIAAGCLIAKSGHSGIGAAKKPYRPHLHYEIRQTTSRSTAIDPLGGVNRLGRSYKFKNRDAICTDRKGVLPSGCVGFL